ncbi:MAG: hypothetical protein MI919_42805, partial [Holophagales bacterium]|nr:hypothetical protein [Holophagales bacterium]
MSNLLCSSTYRRLLLTVLMLALLGVGQANAEVRLHASIAVENAWLNAIDDLHVRVTLTNTGNEEVYILKRNTPFFGITRPLFRVHRDGKPVPYIGPIVHYGHPEVDDYFVLGPGESRSQLVDLSSVYDTR